MNKKINMTTGILVGCIFLSLVSCGGPTEKAIRQVEQIHFAAGSFNLVGELTIPQGKGPFPLVLLVHGDGPGFKTDYGTARGRMLRAGYTTFVWDKPGSGASTGTFEKKQLLSQRAQILCAAIERIKRQPLIDPKRIGVWGISQGGYVMSIALSKTNDIAFVIAVSCPGEASVYQASYLVKSFAECEGATKEIGDEIRECVLAMNSAATYEEYVMYSHRMKKYAKYLKKLGVGSAGPNGKDEWHRSGPEYFFDPMKNIERTKVPILAFFGENDKQADPVQGFEAYKKAIEVGGNKLSQVIMVPGVDHVLVSSATGCIKEWQTRTQKGWSSYSPTYLDKMEVWLKKIRNYQGR